MAISLVSGPSVDTSDSQSEVEAEEYSTSGGIEALLVEGEGEDGSLKPP